MDRSTAAGGAGGTTGAGGGGGQCHCRGAAAPVAGPAPAPPGRPRPPGRPAATPGDGRRSWRRQLGAEPSAAPHAAAAMEVPWVLLAAALLLPPGRATRPLPTLAPPLSMVVAGQRRQLVVCVVSDLAPSSGHAVWISSGNGSILQSFAYGDSQEDGGTACTVSLLNDPLAEGDLACHVGPNRTSPAHSSRPIRITGTALLPPLLPSCPLLPSLVPQWPPRMGAGRQQVRGPAGQRCCPNQRVQEGVCGWPHRTPGAGPLLPPQLLSHPTGNEEAAEPCPGSMAAPLARASAALLMAIRVVLLKVALSDALLTSVLLT
ncbi:protein canopy homolog 3 isoform X2 [Ciconia boyciana]|uniref:protein canopy homolog 3 isoform X2 n=1 Tax=Ciconia boyciana TaxID=52775 RepID=UPI003B9E72EB